MITKEITINGKDHIIGLGDHPSGMGHFIVWKEGRNIFADYIKGGKFSDTLKFIEANVVRIKLDTDELKPLTEYDPALIDKVLEEFTNNSSGVRYSHYYASQQAGSSGTNLYRTALALHVALHHGGVWVLDQQGNFIQPVTFEVSYLETNQAEITVIDGVAPFQYSTDNITFTESNILPNAEEYFVLDSAGTLASVVANAANWHVDSGS